MTVYFPLLMIAFCTGMTLAWREAKKNGISERFILNLSVVIVISALFGSKLFHVLFDGLLFYYIEYPWKIMILWRGGHVFYGGLIFATIISYIYCRQKKISFRVVADLFAPGIALGLAITRVGCYLAGCCYGKISDLPWAIQYGRGFPATNAHIASKLISPEAHFSMPIHPTQLYSVAANFMIFLVLWFYLRTRKRFNGQIFLAFIVLYGMARSTIEIFRDDPRGSLYWSWLSTSQAISVVAIITAATSIVLAKKKV